MSNIYNEKQAADLLQISEFTLANLRKKRQIGYIRIGRLIRYSQQHIEDFIKTKEIISKNHVKKAS